MYNGDINTRMVIIETYVSYNYILLYLHYENIRRTTKICKGPNNDRIILKFFSFSCEGCDIFHQEVSPLKR